MTIKYDPVWKDAKQAATCETQAALNVHSLPVERCEIPYCCSRPWIGQQGVSSWKP